MSINCSLLTAGPSGLYEDDLAFARVDVKRRDPRDSVDDRVEIRMLDLQDVHRGRAGLDVDLAKFLGHPERLEPMSLTSLGSCIDRGFPGLSGFGRETMVGSHPVRSEGVQAPILEKDLHGSAKGGGAGREGCGGGELVVGAGEEHDRDGFVHRRSRPRLSWV